MKKLAAFLIILSGIGLGVKPPAHHSANTIKERLSPRDNISYNKDLQTIIDEFTRQSQLENASVAVSLYDLSTYTFVAEINPQLSLVPASVMKIITTAAALEILGKDTSFSTKIYYSGEIDQTGTLNGDIIIEGGGDPCLGSEAFRQIYYQPDFIQKWVEAIKSVGIKKIIGNILADASVFEDENIPGGWTWIDIPAYYGTPAFGISAYDNQFNLIFNPKRKGKYKVHPDSMKPVIPDLVAENKIRADNREDKYLDLIGVYYSNQRIIKGNLSKMSSSLELRGSIPDPPYLIGYQLKNKLLTSGVSLTGEVLTSRMLFSENKSIPKEKKLICVTISPKLHEIVKRTNMFSVNLYAEHLLNHIGYTRLGLGSTKAGAKALLTYYESKGYDTKGIQINDGSGLARSNTLTTRFIVKVLAGMYGNSPVQQAFYESLPVSGVSGTLRSFCNGTVAEGKIHAKSGTMNRVKCYAGYMTTASEKNIAFAVITNNFSVSTEAINSLLTRLMVNIYNSY